MIISQKNIKQMHTLLFIYKKKFYFVLFLTQKNEHYKNFFNYKTKFFLHFLFLNFEEVKFFT